MRMTLMPRLFGIYLSCDQQFVFWLYHSEDNKICPPLMDNPILCLTKEGHDTLYSPAGVSTRTSLYLVAISNIFTIYRNQQLEKIWYLCPPFERQNLNLFIICRQAKITMNSLNIANHSAIHYTPSVRSYNGMLPVVAPGKFHLCLSSTLSLSSPNCGKISVITE